MKKASMEYKRVLPPNVLFTGLLGFGVTFILWFTKGISIPWALSFGIVFLIMIVGSFWSMDVFSRRNL